MRWFILFIFLLSVAISLLFLKKNFKERELFDSSVSKTEMIENPFETKKGEEKYISMVFTGDVMLGRNVMVTMHNLGNFRYPFLMVYDYLNNVDLVVSNLENPVIEKCPLRESGFTFCSDYRSLKSLKFAGIDVVSLANNHSGNYGQAGLDETKKVLDNVQIASTTHAVLATKDFEGVKVGFLGFNWVAKAPSEDDFEEIRNSASKVDFLAVLPHWGVEYKPNPTANQKLWAREIIDAGADLVVGNHPHWVQGVDCIKRGSWEYIERENLKLLNERVCDKYVFYSLGNFVFDQMWSEETRKGMLVEICLSESGITKVRTISTYIDKVGQPKIVPGN